MKIKLILIAIVYIFIFSSCTTPPVFEIDGLRSTLDIIKNQNPVAYRILADSVANIEEAIAYQQSKFALLRSYTEIHNRISNLKRDILSGKYIYHDSTIEESVNDNIESVNSSDIFFYKLKTETFDVPVDVYYVEILGTSYVYTFSKKSDFFTVTPKK